MVSKMCNFNAKNLCQKSCNFASKSKAIGLPFLPEINGIKKVHFMKKLQMFKGKYGIRVYIE